MIALPLASLGPTGSDYLHLQKCFLLIQVPRLKPAGPAPGMQLAGEQDLAREC